MSKINASNATHQANPKILHVFFLICIYRLVNAWMIRTQFDPDEYWQTLEPAYCLVFASRGNAPLKGSYGCALTWEWTRRWTPSNDETDTMKNIPDFFMQAMHGPIRSYVSILPTYWYYLACRTFFDWVEKGSYDHLKQFVYRNASYIISKGPAFLHAVSVAAPTDLSIWLIALRLEKLDNALIKCPSSSWSSWALFLSLTSWFHGYALIRTYANCFETLCLVVGIVLLGPVSSWRLNQYYLLFDVFMLTFICQELFDNYPNNNKSKRHNLSAKFAFVLGGLSACVRFTSLAAWIPLGFIVTIRSGYNYNQSKNTQVNGSKNDSGASNDQHHTNKVMLQTLIGLCTLYGAVGVGIGCFIDRLMYGFWAIPFLGNFHFNVFLGESFVVPIQI